MRTSRAGVPDFDDDELAPIDEHAVDSGINLWEAPRTA